MGRHYSWHLLSRDVFCRFWEDLRTLEKHSIACRRNQQRCPDFVIWRNINVFWSIHVARNKSDWRKESKVRASRKCMQFLQCTTARPHVLGFLCHYALVISYLFQLDCSSLKEMFVCIRFLCAHKLNANAFCSALEPKISGTIMELHHDKHHRTYVNGYNAAAKELEQVWPMAIPCPKPFQDPRHVSSLAKLLWSKTHLTIKNCCNIAAWSAIVITLYGHSEHDWRGKLSLLNKTINRVNDSEMSYLAG